MGLWNGYYLMSWKTHCCRWTKLTGIALLMCVCFVAAAAVQPAQSPFRADRILIQPKAGANPATLRQFHAAHQSLILSDFAGVRGLQVVQVPAGETATNLIAQYQRSGLVEFAEQDYEGHVFDTKPNEVAYTNGTLWGLNTISAPAAWDVLTDATNIVVAVIDTGIRYTHEDLASNIWNNPVDGSHGWNAIGANNNPTDAGTHGTMVAGVLGAVGNNGKGVCGVAWRTRIMAGAAFNGFGGGNVSDAITCLEFARTNGAKIINASWGFPSSLALSNAMVSLRNAGVIVVAACGNSGTNIDLAPTYPASYAFDNIVTVASVSQSDVLSTFSNYGVTNVDLAAPGEQIYTTFPANDSFYFTDAGTSFAAPYVSGACALLMTQYPTDTYQETITRLLNSTDPLPSLAGKCRTGGRLNLRKALRTILVSAPASLTNAPFQIRVAGGLNRIVTVEATTNFIAWTPIFTNTTTTNSTFSFSDNQTTNFPKRFFRATAAP